MIAAELIRQDPGVPLTEANQLLQLPWTTSPDFPVSVEQVPDPTVTPQADGNRIQWSPDSGGTAREDVWLEVQITESPQPVNFILVHWQDGNHDTLFGMTVTTLTRRVLHAYLADPSSAIEVLSYDENGAFIEGTTVAATLTRSSNYRISQYRIERFRGRLGYTLPGALWIPDWTDFDGSSGQMDFVDAEGDSGWNWGYRIWLREFADHGRPGLTMVPSNWVETGQGEGS
jgi:hypothetical protein